MGFTNTLGKNMTSRKFSLNIDRLEEGMTFKNYKVLCGFLGIPIESSDSKNATLSEIRRKCELTQKEGGKEYTVGIIYNDYEDSKDIGDSETYRMLIRDLLCDQMLQVYKQENKTIMYRTSKSLIRDLSFANEKYTEYLYEAKTASLFFETPEEITELFFRETSQKINNNISYALEWLRKKSLIFYDKVFIVRDKATREMREATEGDKQCILDARNRVLKEMTFTRSKGKDIDLRHIALTGGWKEFSDKVDEELEKADASFSYYYSTYKIQFTSLIESSIKRLNILALPKERYIELNNRFIQSFEKSTLQNLENYKNTDVEGLSEKSREKKIIEEYLEDYPEFRKKLQEELLKIGVVESTK